MFNYHTQIKKTYNTDYFLPAIIENSGQFYFQHGPAEIRIPNYVHYFLLTDTEISEAYNGGYFQIPVFDEDRN